MQIFRQREYVRLGTPGQALAHRNYWLERGEAMLEPWLLVATGVLAMAAWRWGYSLAAGAAALAFFRTSDGRWKRRFGA